MSHAQTHAPLSEPDTCVSKTPPASGTNWWTGSPTPRPGRASGTTASPGTSFFHLRAATRGNPCRAFMADRKMRLVADVTFYFYYHIAQVLSPATGGQRRVRKQFGPLTGCFGQE